jgi:hypothetical protein
MTIGTEKKEDRIFEKIASFYVEQEGENIIDKFPDSTSLSGLDSIEKLHKRIHQRNFWQKAKKRLQVALPVAACLLIVFLLGQPLIKRFFEEVVQMAFESIWNMMQSMLQN